jgi:hypothetical protein
MGFIPGYDDREVECCFCHTKVKPIMERDAMDIGLGMPPCLFFWTHRVKLCLKTKEVYSNLFARKSNFLVRNDT